MASSSNGSSSLVDEFEESFQQCVHALTKQEASTGVEKDEIGMEVDLTTMKFIDLARQMEAFFIQKRFLLSVLKPQLVLKEENVDLKLEISRKDEMIKKHYERIEHWKNMLSDAQQQHMQHLSQQPQPQMTGAVQMNPGVIPSGLMPSPQQIGMSPIHSAPIPMPPGAGMSMQAQLQAQHMQQQQQQQQMMAQHQMHMQQMQLGKLAKR